MAHIKQPAAKPFGIKTHLRLVFRAWNRRATMIKIKQTAKSIPIGTL
ncbi:hypothetical protein AAEO56_02300 [Flavobacterium sp. DGU11]|uniref:Transposase n=1 Tax=Flavobacterium arundinis TaxID=3139143 RepID=A0ABU9HSE1_9FLAO